MNVFYLFGGILAGWALVVSALGIFVRSFPGRIGEKLVIAVSTVLVALAIGAAIVSAGHEEEGGGHEASAATAT